MYNPFSLKDKTVLITGASSGIGKATALECSKLGAKVIITGRNEKRLKEVFANLEGSENKMILTDLSSDNGIKKLLDELADVKINGFVANAGISKPLPLNFINHEKLNEIFSINLEAPILLLSLLLKRKKIEKGASVVFTSSVNGVTGGIKAEGLYSASKGALSGFVKVASLELAPKNIRVNCVCPGMTDTGILLDGTISPEQLEKDAQEYPLMRYGKPEEIAWGIIYLLSDASSFVTGTNLVIDGGISAKL